MMTRIGEIHHRTTVCLAFAAIQSRAAISPPRAARQPQSDMRDVLGELTRGRFGRKVRSGKIESALKSSMRGCCRVRRGVSACRERGAGEHYATDPHLLGPSRRSEDRDTMPAMRGGIRTPASSRVSWSPVDSTPFHGNLTATRPPCGSFSSPRA